MGWIKQAADEKAAIKKLWAAKRALRLNQVQEQKAGVAHPTPERTP